MQACGDDKLSTNVCDTSDDGGGTPPPGCPEFTRCGSVSVSGITTKQNLVPNDTATLTGLVNPNGNLRFKLYKGPGCDAANLIFDSLDIPAGNGDTSTTNAATLKALLAAAGLPTDTAGTYNWLTTYSGDTHGNLDVTSTCGTEHLDVTNG